MRALAVVAGAAVVVAAACGSFEPADTPPASDGGAPPAEGGARSGCPAGGKRFDDVFSRAQDPKGGWDEIDQADGGALALAENALVASAAANGRDDDDHFTTLQHTLSASAIKRACARMTVTIVEPTTSADYEDDEESFTDLVYIASDALARQYWGLSIDEKGPNLYWGTDADDNGELGVPFTQKKEDLMIDVDYEHHTSTLSFAGQSKVFPDSWPASAPLPTSASLLIGVEQIGKAPRAKFVYDDVEFVIYP